jgi:hypothetical protein
VNLDVGTYFSPKNKKWSGLVGKQMFTKIKNILSIFAVLFFIGTMTVTAVFSLAYSIGINFTNKLFFHK